MDSNVHSSNIQVSFSDQEILSLPSSLKGFVGRDVSVHSDQSQTRQVICFPVFFSVLKTRKESAPSVVIKCMSKAPAKMSSAIFLSARPVPASSFPVSACIAGTVIILTPEKLLLKLLVIKSPTVCSTMSKTC